MGTVVREIAVVLVLGVWVASQKKTPPRYPASEADPTAECFPGYTDGSTFQTWPEDGHMRGRARSWKPTCKNIPVNSQPLLHLSNEQLKVQHLRASPLTLPHSEFDQCALALDRNLKQDDQSQTS